MSVQDELKYIRRGLMKKAFLLIAACIVITTAGIFFSGSEFTIYYHLYGEDLSDKTDLSIKWTQKEMEVRELYINDDDMLVMTFDPSESGIYNFSVINNATGKEEYKDELHVNKALKTFSVTTANFSGNIALILSVAILFIGFALFSLIYHKRLRDPLMYTYDAIASFGGGLFCGIVGILLGYELITWLTEPSARWMRYVYELIGNSGQTFLILSAPFLLIFSILIIVSNIELLRHEHFRPKNLLGIATGFLLIAGIATGYILQIADIARTEKELIILYTVTNVYGTVFTYFECILIGSVFCGLRAARHNPEMDLDYILILGCGFRKDGTLTPLLKGRVDRAIDFWKKQKEKTGKQAILIPSGGQGSDEPFPEAEAMGRYIRSCGIPDEAIIQEENSKNTYQNMEFSKTLIEKNEADPAGCKVAFSTTNYHVFRSGVWAGLAGLRAEGMGSRTKWWFWPNAFLRECVGLVVNRLRSELILLVILTIVFGVIAMITIS